MEKNPRWLIFIPLFAIIFLTEKVQATKCYQCKAGNDNCNNPFRAWKSGVKTCEGKFCIKSTATVLGKRATERSCSDRENLTIGCKHDAITLGNKRLCVCKTNLCNASTKAGENPQILVFLMFTVLFSSYAT